MQELAANRISWLSVMAGLVLASCSLAYDFADECRSDSDCSKRGVGLRCVQRLCVQPTDGLGLDQTTADFEAADHQDFDLAPEDTSAPLLQAPCDRLYGVSTPEEALAPDTILFGALMPRSGSLAQLGPYLDEGIELAFSEINQNNGLQGRKFAVLSCDSGTDPTLALAAATHLVSVAKVAAIIGEVSSGITIEVFNRVARPNGVLLLSPVASAPVITSIQDDGLLWRVAPSAAIQGQAMARHVIAEGIERLAVVNRDDTWGNGMREALQEIYCAEVGCDEAHYISRVYADATISADQSEALVAIEAFAPQVVVLISYIEDGASFLNMAAATDLRRFFFGDGARDPLYLDLVQSDEILCRAFGMNFQAPSGPQYDAFRIRFEAKFSHSVVPYVPNAYDAAYLLAYAYAAASANDGSVTGSDIAAGLRRLSAGTAVAAGPSQWNVGVNTLRGAPLATINYAGVSGNVDFSEDTDEIDSAVEGWRFNLSQGGPESLGVIYTIDDQYQPPDFAAAQADATCDAILNPPDPQSR